MDLRRPSFIGRNRTAGSFRIGERQPVASSLRSSDDDTQEGERTRSSSEPVSGDDSHTIRDVVDQPISHEDQEKEFIDEPSKESPTPSFNPTAVAKGEEINAVSVDV